MNLFEHLFKNESGQGLVEYALILALIAMAAVASLRTLGERVIPFYNNSDLQNALSPEE